MFQDLAVKFSHNDAFINDIGEKITFFELQEFSNRIQNIIKRRSIVFCLCENNIGSFCGYFSFINNGIVPLMLSSSIDKDLLLKLINLYNPNYLWIKDENSSDLAGFSSEFQEFGFSLLKVSDKEINLNEQLALLLTTSGSTGSPKLVRLSYKNILANATSISEYLKITQTERPITSLPLYYSYGLSVINSHLLNGATILLTSKSIAQKEFWSFAKSQKASSISGVPYTYEMLKLLRFFRMDLPDLKTLTQAGGKLSPDLVKEFLDDSINKGRRFFVMYGQTEATARMSYLPFEKAIEKYCSIGIAIPGGAFSLIDDNGLTIKKPDIDGELIYSGHNVGLGYANCPEDLSKGDENNGVLHTGDIAYRDVDGFYYITGRKKRFIKIYGNRVNLDASEQIVKEIYSDCACVGIDDKMLVYLTDESFCDEVKTYLSIKTGLNTRAFEVRVVKEIPKNSSGKILYSELKNE